MNPLTWQNPGQIGTAACQSKNFLLLRCLKSLIYNSVAELRMNHSSITVKPKENKDEYNFFSQHLLMFHFIFINLHGKS